MFLRKAPARYAIYRQWGAGAPAVYGVKSAGMIGRRNGRYAPATYPLATAARLVGRMNGLARVNAARHGAVNPWLYAAIAV